MESKDRIVANALDQVIMRTIYDMEQSSNAAKDASVKLSNLYDALLFDDSVSAVAQERIKQYIECTIETTNTEFRHIYLQGAKDSIIVMRTLGVIK